eukprot:CAMPEP_0195642286 /NCGR_PEP_ID=MMETSP0815-20121206/27190_1 /TAXON_ID=97485 /ORGANISM="Prymnesium parvum, Strain Texoma1" /LENGTH=50 /DNA_ID=CAMNT_0040785189 /DNA_START=301 /DNA_END=450 /DNA_ORIENTATION=+
MESWQIEPRIPSATLLLASSTTETAQSALPVTAYVAAASTHSSGSVCSLE